jgi:NDMA-dependent alcohol dehydrogenase
MKTRAAVLWGFDEPWSVEEIELDPPKAGEVLVKIVACGMCHTDEHIVTGDVPIRYPVIGGHEGAGVVEAVGPGTTRVQPGDHVAFSFIPSCGACPSCVQGHQNLCDLGMYIPEGKAISDQGFRARARGEDLGMFSLLGAFSEHTVVNEASVVKLAPDVPLDKAALVSCGVATGWGSAVYAGRVRPGEVVAVVGCGGLGMNAIQGAHMAGASQIIAVDPVEWKRDSAKIFGATHAAVDLENALPLITEITHGRLADCVILTPSVAYGDLIAPALSLVGKRGRAVVTAVAPYLQNTASLNLSELTLWEKELRGAIYGSANPRVDINRLLGFYASGELKLDELITKRYRLDEINEGYRDMRDGRNIRGVLIME